MDDEDFAGAPGRRRTATAAWLSVAGVAVLALGVFIGTRLTADPPPPIASPQVEPLAAPTSPSESTAPAARPGATWLADLAPVDSSSIDDMYVESPWTAGAAKVRKVTYTKSVSATGAWCSTARITFALDGKHERFTAQVAIADGSLETKGLDFFVVADDRRIAEVPNAGTTPQPVDVAVAGARLLTLGVEPPDGDVNDCPGPERVGVWADPFLTTTAAPVPSS
ncbi:MAG: hypothetical protein HOV94_33950 [Saccharothrix sp.]|nr:hypothetical protein [Saccharothrix sp.]